MEKETFINDNEKLNSSKIKQEYGNDIKNMLQSQLTVETAKDQYDYVFDHDPYILSTRNKKEDGSVNDFYFLKNEDLTLIPIPELNEDTTGKSVIWYSADREGIQSFDVSVYNNDNKQTEYTRYTVFWQEQKIIKLFESDNIISKPWTDLYHRNKEDGKTTMKLVDLKGGIHIIKDKGKLWPEKLKEKTFWKAGDFQITFTYNNGIPVFGFFRNQWSPIRGDDGKSISNEFCSISEIECYYQAISKELKQFWISIDTEVFEKMREIIENKKFDDNFMQWISEK